MSDPEKSRQAAVPREAVVQGCKIREPGTVKRPCRTCFTRLRNYLKALAVQGLEVQAPKAEGFGPTSEPMTRNSPPEYIEGVQPQQYAHSVLPFHPSECETHNIHYFHFPLPGAIRAPPPMYLTASFFWSLSVAESLGRPAT